MLALVAIGGSFAFASPGCGVTTVISIGAKAMLALTAASSAVNPALATTKQELRVLLSTATRNRFWHHALSTLSLLEGVRRARLEEPSQAPRVAFEWHVLDDASDQNVDDKDAMVQDLVERGYISNYTRLPRPAGTVRVLGHFVDVFLERPELEYWLHCDDDVLVGPTTLLRAVRDYHRDLAGHRRGSSRRGGGVLAIFVNSWLDEQLSTAPPAFGPYAIAPFLGGASYIVDRASLVATGNPWTRGINADQRISPHEAHVLWFQRLLPEQGFKIWVRFEEPYQCQHLANVNTLNFGKQPDWEPMWALDHRTKRIVEVDGYSSVELRAALWSGGAMFRDFVTSRNAEAAEPLRLRKSAKRPKRDKPWSVWSYKRTHANYIEIGTADFDALIHRHIWKDDIVGFSIEPAKAYFDQLPTHGGASKMLLNVAISDHDGYEDLFLVRPELVDGYFGAKSQCQAELARQVGLQECLPGWVRGTSSIKRWPRGVLELLGEKQTRQVLAMARVPSLTYGTFVTVYGIGSIDVLKIDAEGFDHAILRQVIDFAEATGMWPWQVQFEKNMLSDWRALDHEVARLQNSYRYTCRMTGAESAACWRP